MTSPFGLTCPWEQCSRVYLLLNLLLQSGTWRAVDIHCRQLDETCEPGEDRSGHLHVELHRCGVRVNLDDCHSGAFLVQIHAVRQRPGLVGSDEVHEFVNGGSQFFKVARSDLGAVDEDQRLGRHVPLLAGRAARSMMTAPLFVLPLSLWRVAVAVM